jgi:hypothetical protein
MAANETASLGSVQPVSPLRALDKCLWWIGGGIEGRALCVLARPDDAALVGEDCDLDSIAQS